MIRLRELREKRGLSMKDAADLLNMPYTTYVNYEKGTREPNIETIFKLADFFGVTIDELLGRCAPNEQMLERVAREYLEICGEDCVGDPFVGIPECPFFQYADVLDNGALIQPKCELAAYRRPPEGEEDV